MSAHTEIAPWQFVAHDCGVEIVSIDGPADLVPSGDTAEPTNGICCYPVTQLVHEVCAYR